ncbi:MAG TPA: hypothetical protein VJ967_08995 [Clostridia bacterium]|nr:hypothetical protein [Clostridia bacterium]
MEHIDDLSAAIIDIPILEKYSSHLPELINNYKRELQRRGWKTYKPYTDGEHLKYGIAKSDLLEAYEELQCKAAGLYMDFNAILQKIQQHDEC